MSNETTLRDEYTRVCEQEEIAAREVAKSFETTMYCLLSQMGSLPRSSDMILVADELFQLQESLRRNAEAHVELEAARIQLRDKVYG